MSFDTLELSLVVVRKLRRLHERLRKSDPQLATQIRRAASSVALKLSEGNKRRGRDRQHLFRVAHGSAAEVHTALRVACAWGDLEESACSELLDDLDQIQRMVWGLTKS